MVFVHIGENEELTLNRMEMKSAKEVIRDIVKEFGQPLEKLKGDYSTRLKYDDRCFYITSM